jgi:hypothetical protein
MSYIGYVKQITERKPNDKTRKNKFS